MKLKNMNAVAAAVALSLGATVANAAIVLDTSAVLTTNPSLIVSINNAENTDLKSVVLNTNILLSDLSAATSGSWTFDLAGLTIDPADLVVYNVTAGGFTTMYSSWMGSPPSIGLVPYNQSQDSWFSYAFNVNSDNSFTSVGNGGEISRVFTPADGGKYHSDAFGSNFAGNTFGNNQFTLGAAGGSLYSVDKPGFFGLKTFADQNIPFLLTYDAASSQATFTLGAVPVPAAVWLFSSGLVGLVGVARRRS